MKVWLTLEYNNGNTVLTKKINMPFSPSIGMYITSNEIKGLVEQVFWDVDQMEMRVILDEKTVYIFNKKNNEWMRP